MHFSCLSYDSSSGSNLVLYDMSYDRIRHFRIVLQVQEIREANVRMILSALEQPNREVEQLIKEQKDKYYSKYIFLFTSSLAGRRKIHSWPLKTLFPLILNILYLSFPFTGREPGDEDEPDLPALATLDFAALKDIRQTGIEYCHHYEALLHNTPGLQPGYLPEEESRYLVTGVSIFTSLHCIFLPCD